MNRSMAYVGIAVVAAGFALVAFPLTVLGHEVLDPEQEFGFLLAPLGVVVVLFAAVAPDPRATTVRGAFGSEDATAAERVKARRTAPEGRRPFSPTDPIRCRYCSSIITHDLAQCPRCARARSCRSCRRPLGLVLDRPTCPRCAQPEAFCNCGWLPEGVAPLEPTVIADASE
jgi:hypothetical protein